MGRELSQHEIEALEKRAAKDNESKKDFEDTCRGVADDFNYLAAAFADWKTVGIEEWKKAMRRKQGVLQRLLGWLLGLFSGLARKKLRGLRKTRMDAMREQLSAILSDPNTQDSLRRDTNLNYVMLQIIEATRPSRITMVGGESEEQAVRRITKSYLKDYHETLSRDFRNEEISLPVDKDWEAEVDTCSMASFKPSSDDPLLAYVKKSKLKKALAKDSPDDADRKVIDEALAKRDIIVLD